MTTEKNNALPTDDGPITWDEVRGWVEFFGWTTLALIPFLHWVNGPAVSADQVVVRGLLVAVAAICALGMRSWKLWCPHREQAS